MDDFETNPAGAADLVKQLLHATVSIGGDFDAGCIVRDWAVERIEQLEAALTRANAATAAAYEAAAREVECGCGAGPCQDTANCAAKDAAAIRALATPDQTAALDRLIAEAVKPYVEAMQYYETQFCEGFCEDMPDRSVTTASMEIDCSGCKARAILAASKKGRK